MPLAALLVGTVALTAWVFTVGGVAYALWRFSYAPFVVMRRDVAELAARVAALDRQVQDAVRIKAAVMDDAEVARIERKYQARSAAAGLR